MSLFDAFFLSMIIITGVVSFVVIGIKFVKDMRKEHKRDVVRNKAARNSFQYNRSGKAMAVRNK